MGKANNTAYIVYSPWVNQETSWNDMKSNLVS